LVIVIVYPGKVNRLVAGSKSYYESDHMLGEKRNFFTFWPSQNAKIDAKNYQIASDTDLSVQSINFWYLKAVEYLPIKVDQIFPNLVHYHFYKCAVKEIRRENFENLRKVERVDLRDNELTSIDSDVFYDLTSLKVLMLSENKIESLNEKVFSKNYLLEELTLYDNRFEGFPAKMLQNLSKLRNFNSFNNKIKTIDRKFFENNRKLENVWLSGNHIEFLIPDTFVDLHQLKVVDLTKNQCINKEYDGNYMMRDLMLDLTKFCPGRIGGSRATELFSNAAGNSKYFHTFVLDDSLRVANSKTYQIASNMDDDIEAIFGTSLSIEYLPVKVADTFPELILYEITLCHVKEATKSNFERLFKLQNLNLRRNEISSIDEDAFDDLIALIGLDLSSNRLHTMAFFNYHLLKALNLADNRIAFLDPDTFSGLNFLHYLNLNDNECIDKLYEGNINEYEIKSDIRRQCSPVDVKVKYSNNPWLNPPQSPEQPIEPNRSRNSRSSYNAGPNQPYIPNRASIAYNPGFNYQFQSHRYVAAPNERISSSNRYHHGYHQ
jgi:Leucine-rich repeat (LRR) protein